MTITALPPIHSYSGSRLWKSNLGKSPFVSVHRDNFQESQITVRRFILIFGKFWSPSEDCRWKGMDLFKLLEDRKQWLVLVNKVMEPCGSIIFGIFLKS
jgi:hypothetical protein